MIKVSELTGKPVISLAEAQNLGYISGIWFDGKLTSAKTAEILSDSDDAPERRYVALKSLAVGDDAAVVRSAYLAKESNMQTATAACPINSQCYNQDGKSLGYVCDVILSGDKVTEIICEKASFAPSKLLAMGNALCVFNDSDKPIKPPAPARRKKSRTQPRAAAKFCRARSRANLSPACATQAVQRGNARRAAIGNGNAHTGRAGKRLRFFNGQARALGYN